MENSFFGEFIGNFREKLRRTNVCFEDNRLNSQELINNWKNFMNIIFATISYFLFLLYFHFFYDEF